MIVFNQEDIRRLAANAWIDIDTVEAESLCAGMNRAVNACNALAGLDVSEHANSPEGIAARNSIDAVSDTQCLELAELRDDVPLRGVEQEILMGLSPSDGGYGFMIPRMME